MNNFHENTDSTGTIKACGAYIVALGNGYWSLPSTCGHNAAIVATHTRFPRGMVGHRKMERGHGAAGIHIGECLNLAAGYLRHLGEEEWAIHVPLGKLQTECWVLIDDGVRHIIDRILSLRRQSTPPSAPVAPSCSEMLGR